MTAKLDIPGDMYGRIIGQSPVLCESAWVLPAKSSCHSVSLSFPQSALPVSPRSWRCYPS